MAITHVIRGDDHLTNTARQLAVFAALGAPPPAYAHHGMILDPEGGKLSKRYGATAVGEYREMGYLPEALVNYLALLSWSHGDDEMLDRERLVREFELERLSPSAAVFDLAKLNWLQHEYIMALDPATSTGASSPNACRPASRRRPRRRWRRRSSRRSPPIRTRRPSPPLCSTRRGSPTAARAAARPARSAAHGVRAAAGPRPRMARPGGGPRDPRRLPRLGQGAGPRRTRSAHAAARRAHRPRARPGAALRARGARAPRRRAPPRRRARRGGEGGRPAPKRVVRRRLDRRRLLRRFTPSSTEGDPT